MLTYCYCKRLTKSIISTHIFGVILASLLFVLPTHSSNNSSAVTVAQQEAIYKDIQEKSKQSRNKPKFMLKFKKVDYNRPQPSNEYTLNLVDKLTTDNVEHHINKVTTSDIALSLLPKRFNYQLNTDQILYLGLPDTSALLTGTTFGGMTTRKEKTDFFNSNIDFSIRDIDHFSNNNQPPYMFFGHPILPNEENLQMARENHDTSMQEAITAIQQAKNLCKEKSTKSISSPQAQLTQKGLQLLKERVFIARLIRKETIYNGLRGKLEDYENLINEEEPLLSQINLELERGDDIDKPSRDIQENDKKIEAFRQKAIKLGTLHSSSKFRTTKEEVDNRIDALTNQIMLNERIMNLQTKLMRKKVASFVKGAKSPIEKNKSIDIKWVGSIGLVLLIGSSIVQFKQKKKDKSHRKKHIARSQKPLRSSRRGRR